MEEVRYMISDAAKKINVEPHVLRYWEEELGTGIPRNEMGHRYYREEDIQMMRGVKYLKEKGFQLKSIKILLPDVDKVMQLPQRRLLELRDRLELAVSQEELRLQREEELKKCGGDLRDAGILEDAGNSRETEASKSSGAPKSGEAPGERGDLKNSEAPGECGDLKENNALNACIGKNAQDGGAFKNGSGNAQALEDGRQETERKKASGGAKKVLKQTGGTGMEKEFNGTAQELSAKDTAGKAESAPAREGQAKHLTVRVIGGARGRNPSEKNELQGSVSDNTPSVQASENAVRMQQFRSIMNEIIMDAVRENNKELTSSITASVSKEMEYHMRKREMIQEEHFKQLDRTLREYQLGQKQAAVAKECGGRRESKFFKKNGKVRI